MYLVNPATVVTLHPVDPSRAAAVMLGWILYRSSRVRAWKPLSPSRDGGQGDVCDYRMPRPAILDRPVYTALQQRRRLCSQYCCSSVSKFVSDGAAAQRHLRVLSIAAFFG